MTRGDIAFDEHFAATSGPGTGRERAKALEKVVSGWLPQSFPHARSVLEVGGTDHFAHRLHDRGLTIVSDRYQPASRIRGHLSRKGT